MIRWFLILFIVPLATHAAWWGVQEHPRSWSDADWSSSGILPDARKVKGPVVHVLAGRTGRWKGVFAHHTWIVVKPEGARTYTRYDVVGWGTPVRTNNYPADARWYGNVPDIVVTFRGEEAARMIPAIRAAVTQYPFSRRGDYTVYPGPNSNTFVAYVASRVPALSEGLLPTAIGKDFRDSAPFFGPAPSATGWQVSWRGLVGVTVGWVEGVEINLFGLVAGVDIRRPAIKLPGWGRIGWPLSA